MADFLVSLVQSVCLIGYLYGAWIVVTHVASAGSGQRHAHRQSLQEPDQAESAAWHRYLTYDS